MNSYYPFGLQFNSYQRVTAKENKYKTFQNQEKITALDLNWIQFKWRNHDPTIGRFFNVDPLAESYVYNSPYAFSENKLISFRELEGLEAEKSIDEESIKRNKEQAKQDATRNNIPRIELNGVEKESKQGFGFVITEGGQGGPEPATEDAEHKEILDKEGMILLRLRGYPEVE